jgi:hypothetical protein
MTIVHPFLWLPIVMYAVGSLIGKHAVGFAVVSKLA